LAEHKKAVTLEGWKEAAADMKLQTATATFISSPRHEKLHGWAILSIDKGTILGARLLDAKSRNKQ